MSSNFFFAMNIDHIFGDPQANACAEPITPFKTALYILICVIEKAHFRNPMGLQTHAEVARMLYGLSTVEDLSCYELRKAVAYMNTLVPAIKQMFDAKLLSSSRGCETLFRVDDLLVKDNILLPHVVTHKSHLMIFLKKLQVSRSRMSQQEIFDEQKNFIAWVRGEQIVKNPDLKVPYEINNSSRAHLWLSKQLHLIQVSPLECDAKEKRASYCQLIKRHHKDLTMVHLLESLMGLQRQDFHAAKSALHLFIDKSALKWNDSPPANLTKGTTAIRLTQLDHKIYRYGALLQARLHRIFEDPVIALALLNECIQLAQMSKDDCCLRLAMVEKRAQEMDREMTEEEADHKVHVNVPTSSFLSTTNTQQEAEERAEMNLCSSEHVREAQATQLTDLILLACQDIKKLSVDRTQRIGNLLTQSQVLVSLPCDEYGRSRMTVDAGTAIVISLRFMQGFYKQARVMALSMLDSNRGDRHATKYDTESYAVAGVNVVYTLAMDGKWREAMQAVKELKERFPTDYNWQAARHVNLCESIVLFDKCLVATDWDGAEEALNYIKSKNTVEAELRLALFYGVRGTVHSGIKLLEKTLCKVESKWTALEKMRTKIALASLHIRDGSKVQAKKILFETLAEANEKDMGNLRAMIHRRIGLLMIENRQLDEAFHHLNLAEWDISQLCGCVERALYAATRARFAIVQGQSENAIILWLGRWKVASETAGIMVWAKEAMRFAKKQYQKMGKTELMQKAADEYARIHAAYPRELDWMCF